LDFFFLSHRFFLLFQKFEELDKINITTENSQEVVQQLVNLIKTTELNAGDTFAAVNIIKKLATGSVLAPKNSNESKQAGQVSTNRLDRLVQTGRTG
jgi:hypothetical protein